MKPIAHADYYTQFQTALFIAVEELGVKQAALAEACGISPGYLSKLRGWNRHSESKALIQRPHMTNTNFKAYAIPLLEVLREHDTPVHFEAGWFVQQAVDGPKQWGALALTEVEMPEATPDPLPDILPQLDGIEFPPEGELTIEWAFDFERDPAAEQKAVALLRQLSNMANNQVVIKVKLNTPRAFTPPKAAPQEDLFEKKLLRSSGVAKPLLSPEDLEKSFSRPAPLPPSRQLPALIPNTPFFNLLVHPSGISRGFEHITVRDSKNDRLIEQFCDLSQWNVLAKKGAFTFDADRKQISGSGLHHYLLSRYEYGRQPYLIHAELEFQQYARQAGNSTDQANAGFILGWNHDGPQPSYYHLLLTGEKMLLERVGAQGGDAYDDFEHLDAGVDFRIEDGVGYHFLLRVGRDSLDVVVDHRHVYHVALPEGITGQVGLRPWRAEVACRFFEVREIVL